MYIIKQFVVLFHIEMVTSQAMILHQMNVSAVGDLHDIFLSIMHSLEYVPINIQVLYYVFCKRQTYHDLLLCC